jgi:predicted aldo/keto reductase-like oxidoreductase
MTGPETVAAAVRAATTGLDKKDEAVARAHHEAVRGRGCPIPCPSPCLTACPAGVAVPDVLRHRMYDRHFGLTDQARLEYRELPVLRRAQACLTCVSQACVTACPEGLPVASLTRDAHRHLGNA